MNNYDSAKTAGELLERMGLFENVTYVVTGAPLGNSDKIGQKAIFNAHYQEIQLVDLEGKRNIPLFKFIMAGWSVENRIHVSPEKLERLKSMAQITDMMAKMVDKELKRNEVKYVRR